MALHPATGRIYIRVRAAPPHPHTQLEIAILIQMNKKREQTS